MRAPLSAQVRLGLQLGLGALLLVAAAWLFGAIAEDVVSGDRITGLDVEIAQWLHRHATPAVTAWMRAITQIHSTFAIGAYATLAVLFLWIRRDWRRLTLMLACIAGGMTLNVLMKLAFHRARPAFDDPLLSLTTYSFPSGHVAASTIFYGLGVAWVFARTRDPLWRGLALAGAAFAIVLVAFTRMYLGVHYLSDVAAAFAEGIAWLALCFGAFAAFWRRTGVPLPVDPAR